jgi:hypothetical protein
MRVITMILCVFFLSTPLFAEDEIVFQYAFVAKDGDNAVRLLDTSGTHTQIDPDSRVRILLKPVKNAYCYFFLHDAEGDVTVLFPEPYDALFDGDAYFDTLYRIPGPASWLVPNGKNGTESFFLLVSQVRLSSLESLVEIYLRVPASAIDKKKKAALDILDEITMTRRVHSSFGEKAVSPVVIAGDYRGDDATGNPPAHMIEVRAAEFYAKTIRLVH